MAPFAANTALVLHKCPADNGAGVKYLVQALHNEKPVLMPVSNYYIKLYVDLEADFYVVGITSAASMTSRGKKSALKLLLTFVKAYFT